MCMRKQIAMAEENPLKRGTINTADYPMPLLIKILTCHYQIGTTEVHVVFDNPQRLELSLKIVERERRDKKIVMMIRILSLNGPATVNRLPVVR